MTVADVTRLRLDTVSLFLDLDGTLAPFAATPDGVGPDRERNARLKRVVERLNGRVAVVSGRSLSDLDRILEGAVAAMAGSHGLERRTPGALVANEAHPQLALAMAELERFAGQFADVRIETKPLSVAFHYRGNPSVEPMARVFADDLASRTGLKLQRGSMVAEFLTPGGDKGQAVRAFMAEAPFSGTKPIFVGDDLTDEDGFSAATAHGGFGVLVGPKRETQARYRLSDERAVHAWLDQALSDNVFSLESPL
ncbi:MULTISPECIES: trehalose-phosphatase [Asticcacaulis]|uniref:trehalose-phosphatase n=1 Tax=Asticcacaulis TaxID=76890 RepID=UPI001AE79840|nr:MULTISPECIES: trehalose-phosphatase [Asticcacaulis]MBP2157838.1 trehalose 6-phosphate phosphatase [Asticcacaulis solisilvae]MDR6798883.1 trehalose 6-phosphate phosphatase [Asticcacaulis sp. BE141]